MTRQAVPANKAFRHGKEHEMRARKKPILRFLAVPLAVGLLSSIGCSTANWPIAAEQRISRGEEAIEGAKRSTASIHASEELKIAEDKLSLARKEFANGWYSSAARLAEEAAAAAEYAEASATTVKTKKTAEEIRANIEELKKDIEIQSR